MPADSSIELVCAVAMSCWLKVLCAMWSPLRERRTWAKLTYVSYLIKVTHIEQLQVYPQNEELDAWRKVAARARRWVAALAGEAWRKVVLMPAAEGPIVIWEGRPKRISLDHDSVHDEP